MTNKLRLEALISTNKFLQVGEIGLDWTKTEFPKDKQIEIFLAQLDIAESNP
jgi:Tat protein secretion system quality control protein TatD with DNase activity